MFERRELGWPRQSIVRHEVVFRIKKAWRPKLLSAVRTHRSFAAHELKKLPIWAALVYVENTGSSFAVLAELRLPGLT